MRRNFIWILLLFIAIFSWSIAYANENIDSFWNFLDDIETVKKAENWIKFSTYYDDLQTLENKTCVIEDYNTYSYISPVCLLKNTSYLSVSKSLEYLTKNLNMFYDMYQQDSYNFIYKATEPSYSYSIVDNYLKYRWSIYEKLAILYWTHENKMIMVDNYVLARLMFQNYSFYSVPTNLANRWPCSLTNYKLAISKLSWKELKPGEILDLNALISNDSRSCKWNSTKSFLFYWWSCWASSQLFRLSLIMPNITVLDRAWHAKWRALYYGSNIMWDDAAMYENSKKFVIRNDFESSIYFVAYEKWNYVYLVWVVPNKVSDFVKIDKKVNWYRSSVFKYVYDVNWYMIWEYQFDSVYSSIYWWRA